jgi:hypothetical protein
MSTLRGKVRVPREHHFTSRLRSPTVTARVGLWLGIAFGIAFVTGLIDYLLGHGKSTPMRSRARGAPSTSVSGRGRTQERATMTETPSSAPSSARPVSPSRVPSVPATVIVGM